MIPDGQLCSGGIADYRGLDLPRPDWPATKLTAGAAFTFSYRETIPHEGTFRLYVTKDGYTPSQPLTWGLLEAKPFLTVVDPPLKNNAYVFKGTLPRGKTGRHLIYTIWQNSSTPDTYYSCSDVVFGSGASRPSAAAPPPAKPAPAGPADQGAGGLGAADSLPPVNQRSNVLPLAAGGASAVAVAALVAAFAVRRRRA